MGHFDQGRNVLERAKFNPGIRKTKMEECDGPDVRGRGRGGKVGVAHPSSLTPHSIRRIRYRQYPTQLDSTGGEQSARMEEGTGGEERE
jgi:hypothetical protein